MKTLPIIILLLFLTIPASAQNRGMKPQSGEAPAGTERRLALVVGNKDYQRMNPLRNPVNDANDMEVALKTLGFEVIKVVNTDYRTLIGAVNRFRDRLGSIDVALVYYSGHGVSYGGKNYLMPVDADIRCLDQIEEYGLSLNRLLEDITAMKVRNSFVFLDACRNLPNLKVCNATQRDFSPAVGLVKPSNNPRGSMVVYATKEGSTADDNIAGKNGLFTAALLKYFTLPNLGIRTILDQTTVEVEEQSGGRQAPGRYDELRGDFVFVQTAPAAVPPPRLEPPVTAPATKLEPAKTNTRSFLDLPFAEMVWVEGGSFQMGDSRNEGSDNEKPVHQVTVDGFWMGRYEVTQRQWQEIMGRKPNRLKKCDDCPIEQVSWEDVHEFLKKLNVRTGWQYRLPTEAEWEYAAGGGSNVRTRFGNGKDIADPQEINFNGSADYKRSYSVAGENRRKALKVGNFAPNGLGLYDMSGNVYEWCSDWYGLYPSGNASNPTGAAMGSSRVFRGGAYGLDSPKGRVAFRGGGSPSFKWPRVGFRIVIPQ